MGNCLSCILPKKKVPQTESSSKNERASDNERERLLKDVNKEDSGDHGSEAVPSDVTDSRQKIPDDKQTSHIVEVNGDASGNSADQKEQDKRESLNEFVFSGDINDLRHIDSVLSVLEEHQATDSTNDSSLLKSMFKSLDPNNQQNSDNSAISGRTEPKIEDWTSEKSGNSTLPTTTAGEVKDFPNSSNNASEIHFNDTSAKVSVEPVVSPDRDDAEVEERIVRMESKASVGGHEGSVPKQKDEDRPRLTEFLQTLTNSNEDEGVTDFDFFTKKLLSENQLKRDSDNISIGLENDEKNLRAVSDQDIETRESIQLNAQASNLEEDDKKSDSHHENLALLASDILKEHGLVDETGEPIHVNMQETETLSELQGCTPAGDPVDVVKKHDVVIKDEDRGHKIDNTESHSEVSSKSNLFGEEVEFKNKELNSEHSADKNSKYGDIQIHESTLNQVANKNTALEDDVTDETGKNPNNEKNNTSVCGEEVKTQDGGKQNDNLSGVVAQHSLDGPESLWSILSSSALSTDGTPNTDSTSIKPENNEGKADTMEHTRSAVDASETK